MIFSMTGFSRVEKTYSFGSLVCEIRSLNHRYLDLSLRLPEELRVLEPVFRKSLSTHLSRGKVELGLRYNRDKASSAPNWVIDQQQLDSVKDISQQLGANFPGAQSLSTQDLLNWPGLVSQESVDQTELHAAAVEIVKQATEELSQARRSEGKHISGLIEERLDTIEDLTGQAQKLMPEVAKTLKQRVFDKVEEFAAVVDQQRVEQELAILLQKMDVDEELDRLTGHIAAMRDILTKKPPVGRKLDFLTQELHREANTLGSKSISGESSRLSVDLKVLIEQIREQVQNIE